MNGFHHEPRRFLAAAEATITSWNILPARSKTPAADPGRSALLNLLNIMKKSFTISHVILILNAQKTQNIPVFIGDCEARPLQKNIFYQGGG
jgi:hypothetical protein